MFALSATGQIQPYCEPAETASGIYEVCRPCGMHGTVFFGIEANQCDNSLITWAQMIFLIIPWFVLVIAVMLSPFWGAVLGFIVLRRVTEHLIGSETSLWVWTCRLWLVGVSILGVVLILVWIFG